MKRVHEVKSKNISVRPSPVGWNPGNAIQQKRNTNPIRFPSSAEQRIDYAEMDLDYETGYLRHQKEQQAQGSQVCNWEIMSWLYSRVH